MPNGPRYRTTTSESRVLRYAVLLIAVCGTGKPARGEEPLDLPTIFREGIPASPFIAVVYRCADTLLEHGRDTYGPKQTGLLLGALDRKSLAPLKNRPPAPRGVSEEFRPGPRRGPLVGANLQMDQNTLRLLYFLVGLSGESRYAQAADDALTAMFENGFDEKTGRLPWGEHACWNTMTDQTVFTAETPSNRFLGPWMLWPECFRVVPQQAERFAAGLCEAFLSGEHESVSIVSSPRQVGFLLRTFAEAYAQTGDKKYLTAIERLAAEHQKQRSAAKEPIAAGAILSLAIDCHGAARKVPEPLRTRLMQQAAADDRLFCSLPHDLTDRRGFVATLAASTATPGDTPTPLWNASHDRRTTANVAIMCMSRYENTGKVPFRELIIAAADAYLDSLPDDRVDAWPGTFGHAISLQLAAFRITAQRKYHARAFQLGEIAIERFFGEQPLPRASLKSDHYESTTGSGTLLLALAELHLSTLHITAVRTPANTIDR